MTPWCDAQLYAKELTAERLRRAEHARLLGQARYGRSGDGAAVTAPGSGRRLLVLWAAVWYLMTHALNRFSL